MSGACPALADLGMAGQAVDQADIDIPVLIGLDPGLRLHVVLADHGAGFHRGMDLVAGAVEKAGVDEADPLQRVLDAGLEVDRGAALIVHDADLHGVLGQRQHLLDPGEQVAGQRDLVGAMHLRLDDIDRTGAAVARLRAALEVMYGQKAGDRGVEQPFGNLGAGGVEHRVGEHVVADIAHQQKAAAMQLDVLAVGRDVGPIGIERALERLAALLEIRRQRAVHQAERIAVDQHLVLGINRRDAVLHIENRANRRFHDHIGNAGRIVLADHVAAVDLDLDMHAVVDQQDRGRRGGFAPIARVIPVLFSAVALPLLSLTASLPAMTL